MAPGPCLAANLPTLEPPRTRAFALDIRKSLEREMAPGPCLVEQVTGIEPALSAWEAEVLPLHHTCAVYPAKYILLYRIMDGKSSPSQDAAISTGANRHILIKRSRAGDGADGQFFKYAQYAHKM